MISAIVITVLIASAVGLSVKTAGGGIAEAAAGIRGKPSPAAQKWEAREKARRAEGLPSRKRPTGAFRTVWQNAVEEWVVKQTQKHHGRLEGLRELGPQNSSKAKKKLLRQAEFRARLAATSAKWFGTGRERLHKISSDLREVIADKRAEFAGRRAGTVDPAPDADRQQQAAEALADLTPPQTDNQAEGPDAKVIPIHGHAHTAGDEQSQASEQADPNGQADQETHNSTTNPGGTDNMTTATATQSTTAGLPEPTDLASAITYTEKISEHMGKLGDKIGEDATVFESNAQGLHEQVSAIENGQAALAQLGFTEGAIQDGLAKTAELAPAAAANFAELQRLAALVGEQLTEIRDAMKSAHDGLTEQRGISDEVQAQDVANGTANDTRFYREG